MKANTPVNPDKYDLFLTLRSVPGAIWKGLLLAAVIWVLTNVVKPTKKLHPIVYIAASAVVGIVFSFAGV